MVHYSSFGKDREDHRPAFHCQPWSCQSPTANLRRGPRANEAASRVVGNKGYFSLYSAKLFSTLPNNLLSPFGFRQKYWGTHRGDYERDVTQGSPQRFFEYRGTTPILVGAFCTMETHAVSVERVKRSQQNVSLELVYLEFWAW